MNPKWGFDLDEVLCDFFTSYFDIAKQYFNVEIPIEDVKDYYIHKAFGSTLEEMNPVLDIANKFDHLIRLPVLLDGLTAIKKIKSIGCAVFIITARYPTDSTKEATEVWLKKHNVPYDGLYMTGDTPKIDVCQKLDIQYFVDDNPKHANPIAEKGIKVFMPKYPWNENADLHENVQHLNTTSEILGFIDDAGFVK